MRDIDIFSGDAGRLDGILDAAPTLTGGRILRRLPAWTRDQVLDLLAEFIATYPAGARLDLVTDSTSIELDAQLTTAVVGGVVPPPAVFDLEIDGDVVASESTDRGHVFRVELPSRDVTFDEGGMATIAFSDLPAGTKRLTLWLPQSASLELRAVRIDDGATVATPPEPSRRWVHYGSSISQCGEAVRPTHCWPVVTARLAGVSLQSLAFGGECLLDQYVARTIRDLDVDAISLKVGINVVNTDSMRERTFLSAVQGFLDTIREGHVTTPIMLITPIICPAAEDHPGPTLSRGDGTPISLVDRPADLAPGALTIGRVREFLTEIVAARQKAGDANLHLVDGRSLFGPDDLTDLPDGLHPNDAGYVRMGERFHALAFGAGRPFAVSSEP
ncbi:MAG: SGNH/GDSL hydrolase family protein [Chloroflexota bacterium]